jgi:hypothetical protein
MVMISEARMLALDITPKGVAFAVLEGRGRLYDSGMTYVPEPSKHAYVEKVEHLLLEYLPYVLVMEDTEGEGFKKGPRTENVLKRLELLSISKTIPVVKVARKNVLRAFGTKNKYQTAEVIARIFPVLEKRLPRYRRPWESETDRANVFDAVSLALTASLEPLDLDDIPA